MVQFRILRYDPDLGNGPRYEEYDVGEEPGMTVLDGLLEIKAKHDSSLTFRTACEVGVCGSCVVEINGRPRPACKTQLSALAEEEGYEGVVKINPLPGFDVIKDLVVDIDPFFEAVENVKPYMISEEEPPEREERIQSPQNMMTADGPMSCIMCMACLSGCPVNWSDTLYPGPAVLTKVSRFALDSRDMGEERMSTIAEDIWECTTCNYCSEICLKEINIPENAIKMKEYFIEKGRLPTDLKDALESIYTRGNPYQGSKRERIKWTEGLDVERYEDQEILWFVGCTLSYDDLAQQVARSMLKILRENGESFGILGREEKCCGHPAKRAGERGLFEELVEENADFLRDLSPDVLLTNCAHSYYTFVNEYPSSDFEILHSTQYLHEVMDDIHFEKELERKVTYHDPCYLGRYSEIYDIPREVLRNLPGLNFVEMERRKGTALCCGGGSNHMWIEEPDYWEGGGRIANERIDEAIRTGADILAVACPFCLATLNAAAEDRGKEIEVKSITEMVAETM